MKPLPALLCLLVSLTSPIRIHAALLWAADFDSYDTSAGPAELAIRSTGGYDTFSAKEAGDVAIAPSFLAKVTGSAPAPLSGNALRLSLSNGTTGAVTNSRFKLFQNRLSTLGSRGLLVMSCDILKDSGSAALSSLSGHACKPDGSRSGNAINYSSNTSLINARAFRYTLVVNRSGAGIALPGGMGNLPTDSTAAYFFDGTSYSGLSITDGVTSMSIAGFSIGLWRSGSLASGENLAAWLDNLSVWDTLTTGAGGASVLSLAPGYVAAVPADSALRAGLVWSSDFESYATATGTVALRTNATGCPDTFSEVVAGDTAIASGVLARVSGGSVPAPLRGNALKLSVTNHTGSTVTASHVDLLQHHQTAFGNGGVLVMSCDVVKDGASVALSSISGNATEANGVRAGAATNYSSNTSLINASAFRYTMVVNRSGANLALPGGMGALPTDSVATYFFNGSAYSGLAIKGGATSPTIAGFRFGAWQSGNLAAGQNLTVWLDNMGVWNALTQGSGGVSVLSLRPGHRVPAATDISLRSGLIWSANFDSYETAAGWSAPAIESTGGYDTFSATEAGDVAIAPSFLAEVAGSAVPAPLSGNALRLSLTNGTAGAVTNSRLKLFQNHLAPLGNQGLLVMSCDVLKSSGSAGLSSLSGHACKPDGTRSGNAINYSSNSSLINARAFRYTLVVNRSGAGIALPGGLGNLPTDSTASYLFDGTSYSGLSITDGVTSTSIAGFSLGLWRSSGLAIGENLTVWLDNLGVWNALTTGAGGVAVLSLPPGYVVPEPGVVWHVDAAGGSDLNDGGGAQTAFATIQHAVDQAEPGDTVLVHPGVYFENVVIRRAGRPSVPIRLMADEVEEGRVILTGAIKSVREGGSWQLVNSGLGLYRMPLGYKPTRVLANNVDLMPYPSRADLEAFGFVAIDYAGPPHGFAWNAADQYLYVRLRQDGAYGATNPNSATMAVSPPTGGGTWGTVPTGPGNFLVDLQMLGSAHVIIDGFTFETPGIAAVHTRASDLVVRNSWFYGCRIGVDGADAAARSDLVDRVTLEQCYLTHFPCFSDGDHVIRQEGAPGTYRNWWQRKGRYPSTEYGVGGAYGYELGAARGIGDGWIVRNNHFHEMFEALPGGGTRDSLGLEIYGNRFERLCDNAVETEEHSTDLRIHDNLVIDTYEPFSWQPAEGQPLPGPLYIHHNTLVQTAGTTEMWSIAGTNGGLIKMGIASGTPQSTAPGGFWVIHNTFITPQGRLVTPLSPSDATYSGFNFINNVIGTRKPSSSIVPLGLIYDYNFVATSEVSPTTAEVNLYTAIAGAHGLFGTGLEDLDIVALANGGAVPGPNSPGNGQGLTSHMLALPGGGALAIPGHIPMRSDAGAVAFSATVGPRPR